MNLSATRKTGLRQRRQQGADAFQAAAGRRDPGQQRHHHLRQYAGRNDGRAGNRSSDRLCLSAVEQRVHLNLPRPPQYVRHRDDTGSLLQGLESVHHHLDRYTWSPTAVSFYMLIAPDVVLNFGTLDRNSASVTRKKMTW